MEKKYQIGNFITQCREEKRMTQSKLGELLGVSNKAVSKWENGKSLPNTKLMTKLCEVLGVSLDELLNGKHIEIDEKDTNLTEFEHVFKYYNNDSRVEIGLYDINLSFNLGEIVAICGVSGSGKTTLIKTIGGLDTIESGEIYLQKEGISRYDEIDFEEYRKSYISYIFQDYGILENYTILDNLLIIRLLMGDSYEIALLKANNMLKEIDLYKFKDKKASKLSGGQKQKLSVARAIIKDAPILLGDEITANLDSKQAKEILKLLMDHAENKLVILVTHNFAEIEEYVTRKISLEDGRIIEDMVLKDVEKQPLKLNKVSFKEKQTLPFILAFKYFKTNIWKSLLMILVVLIAGFTILGVNYVCDYGHEETKYVTNEEAYQENEVEILYKEGLTKSKIDGLLANKGIKELRLLSVSSSLNEIWINNDLKDNEIKGPKKRNSYFVDSFYNDVIVKGNYIENEDKENHKYYLNYKNYLLLHKLATTNYNGSYFALENKDSNISNTNLFIEIDLNNHENIFKTSLDDNFKLFFAGKELNLEHFCNDIDYDLYVSSDYLEKVLEPYDIITYGARIQYDTKLKNKVINYLKENNYLYIDNDVVGKETQSSEMLFMNELLFSGISILPFLAMIFLANKALYAFTKSRQKELCLLRKIGFSKDSILKTVLIPIILTLLLFFIIMLFFILLKKFLLTDLLLLMLFEEITFSYLILKNIKIKLGLIIKEEE